MAHKLGAILHRISRSIPGVLCTIVVCLPTTAFAQPERNPTYVRLKAHLDAVPAIDTHDHLWPFDKLPGYVETENGKGMNLAGLWRNSYFTRVKPVTPWTPGGKFDDWWAKAKHDFDDARAVSFYRYQLPPSRISTASISTASPTTRPRDLNRRIFRNYLNEGLALSRSSPKRANIELMFNDPYWARFDFKNDYPFGVLVFNVTTLMRGFHPAEFKSEVDDPYVFAQGTGLADRLAGRLPRRARPAVCPRPRRKGPSA